MEEPHSDVLLLIYNMQYWIAFSTVMAAIYFYWFNAKGSNLLPRFDLMEERMTKENGRKRKNRRRKKNK